MKLRQEKTYLGELRNALNYLNERVVVDVTTNNSTSSYYFTF